MISLFFADRNLLVNWQGNLYCNQIELESDIFSQDIDEFENEIEYLPYNPNLNQEKTNSIHLVSLKKKE